MTSHRARLALAAALACALLLAALPAPRPAAAATCVVTSPADGGPGTLRAAVGNTDGFADCDTITFADAIATVTLTSAELAVARDLTIQGRGVGGVRVERSDAPATPEFRLFRVSGGAHLTLRGLTLAKGAATGDGFGDEVFVDASRLTVEASVVTGGSVGQRGGIFALAAGADAGATVTVTGSTLSGNTAAIGGGGINATTIGNGASATVTVTDSTLSDNTASNTAVAAIGGGINANASAGGSAAVTVTDSTLSGNSADIVGGGIAVDAGGGGSATLTVTRSTLSGNSGGTGSCGFTCGGGGIHASGSGAGTSAAVTVTDSTLTGNTAAQGLLGGGIDAIAIDGASAALTVTGSTLTGNSGMVGGGINASGSGDGASAAVTVTGSTLTGNTAGSGGGIGTLQLPGSAVTLTVTGSTLSGNSGLGGGGGIAVIGAGASTAVTVTGSTLTGNTSQGPGGGISFGGGGTGAAALTVTNSTLSGNTAKVSADGTGPQGGGAIFALGIGANPTVALADTTLADNTADSGQGHMVALVGGSGTPVGGTVSATVANSVFAHGDTALGGTFFAATGATFTSGGHNVSQRDLPGSASGDLASTDPLLGPLADNGGPTRTRALLPGSPAIDLVPVTGANCPAADQRGVPRPQGAGCESGAVEFIPLVNLTVATVGDGTVGRAPAGTGTGPFVYESGTLVTLTPQPGSGQTFTGWVVDGVVRGWASPLTLTMGADHTVQATFAPAPNFPDVGAGRPDYAAIVALATRGTIRGYANGTFGPDDGIQRAQMAALIARAMPSGPDTPRGGMLASPDCLVAGTWDCEDWGTFFTDRGGLDANLWRNAGTLQHYQVTLGYAEADCAAGGMVFPCYGPTDPVTYAQTISFITRAMVVKGYWANQPGAPASAGVPAVHAADVATFAFYTGGVPAAPTDWNAPATRGWFALALWRALDSYWGAAGVP